MPRSERIPVDSPSRSMTRRQILQRGAFAALGVSLLAGFPRSRLGRAAEAAAKKPARILYFTKSSGFEHGPIKWKGDAPPSHSGGVLADLGKTHAFEVLESKDGRIFDSKDLDDFDALFFYTSGNLTQAGTDKHPPMTEAGKKRLLDVVAGGKGFLGAHSATDTFHTSGPREENQEIPDPYIAMLGGEFISHGRQQKAKMRVCSPTFPDCEGLGRSFDLLDEWYSLKNFAKDLHVILVNETEGMTDWQYDRPPFPSTWARMHGKGRVFHTAMGHREDVWTNPLFQRVLLGGIAWALGREDADLTPNIDGVTPKAGELPKKPQAPPNAKQAEKAQKKE